MPSPCCAVLWQNGMARVRHGICESNLAALCKSNGKDNLNPLWHGLAGERHGMWISLKGAHTHMSLARVSTSGRVTREPGPDISYHSRMSGFWLVTLHTQMSLTHWNSSPVGLASQTLTCMGILTPWGPVTQICVSTGCCRVLFHS
jgi:hypothetical protein